MIKDQLASLMNDLRSWISEENIAEIQDFMRFNELECAYDLLWACVSLDGRPIKRRDMLQLSRTGQEVEANIQNLELEFPIVVSEN